MVAAPPALVASGDYDAMRLRSFATERDGTPVAQWQLFREASLFQEAAK